MLYIKVKLMIFPIEVKKKQEIEPEYNNIIHCCLGFKIKNNGHIY